MREEGVEEKIQFVWLISSDPPCKDDNTRFTITTASLKGLSDKLWTRYPCFSCWKTNDGSFHIFKVSRAGVVNRALQSLHGGSLEITLHPELTRVRSFGFFYLKSNVFSSLTQQSLNLQICLCFTLSFKIYIPTKKYFR